jgi:hypothetical protein
MVKGRIYKLANLHKNKINNYLISYNQGQKDGIGWLWTSNHRPHVNSGVFEDGAAFVCLGKKIHDDPEGHGYYGITTWYEAAGPDGKIHRITPAMRSSYFRSP